MKHHEMQIPLAVFESKGNVFPRCERKKEKLEEESRLDGNDVRGQEKDLHPRPTDTFLQFVTLRSHQSLVSFDQSSHSLLKEFFLNSQFP